MAMRVMFSTPTAITPGLLVLDEVLISLNNTERNCRFMTGELAFNQAKTPEGPLVEMRLSRTPLGRGSYAVAVEIARGSLSHAFEFTVTDSGWIVDGTLFEGDGEWSMKAVATQTRA